MLFVFIFVEICQRRKYLKKNSRERERGKRKRLRGERKIIKHSLFEGKRGGQSSALKELSDGKKKERTVGRRIDRLRQLGDGDFEPRLNEFKNLLILVRGNEGDG